MKTTNVTISKKQENKGAKGILDLTSTLGQTLRTFEGVYARKLPDCDGLTVEKWMSAHGVERVTTKGGKKKGYTPRTVADGWHENMKIDNTLCVFRKVAAKIIVNDDDFNSENGVAYRVFTKEEAEKIDGKPISRYMLVKIAENKWSVNTILKGLKQTNNFEKENNTAVESELTWATTEKVYIVKLAKAENGEITRKIIEVNKANVVF